jgi:hypothetical protein
MARIIAFCSLGSANPFPGVLTLALSGLSIPLGLSKGLVWPLVWLICPHISRFPTTAPCQSSWFSFQLLPILHRAHRDLLIHSVSQRSPRRYWSHQLHSFFPNSTVCSSMLILCIFAEIRFCRSYMSLAVSQPQNTLPFIPSGEKLGDIV